MYTEIDSYICVYVYIDMYVYLDVSIYTYINTSIPGTFDRALVEYYNKALVTNDIYVRSYLESC